MKKLYLYVLPVFLCCLAPLAANAQSFRVQCPTSTITHPVAVSSTGTVGPDGTAEPAYNGPTQFLPTAVAGTQAVSGTTLSTPPGSNGGFVMAASSVNGAIKCQQISGGDGFAIMADGTQEFMFSFGPLSGLADIAAGLPGTQYPDVFNVPYAGTTISTTSTGNISNTESCTPGALCTVFLPGDPATSDGASDTSGYLQGGTLSSGVWSSSPFTYNGAVGITPWEPFNAYVFDASNPQPAPTSPPSPPSTLVTIVVNYPVTLSAGDVVTITGVGTGYDGTWAVTNVGVANAFFNTNQAFQYDCSKPLAGGTPPVVAPACTPPLAEVNLPTPAGMNGATASSVPTIDGHVNPREIMDVGIMNGNIPAPLMAFDEDDEFFLTLSNVGMIMRPDLFEQHTVHFHGYPNASSVYDGVPDASVAINIGGSFTYYYLAPDAGTYFWHCHITPPEHLQMGMVGQLYVRPRQNRVPAGASLYTALKQQNGAVATGSAADLRTVCNPAVDILCSTTLPTGTTTATRVAPGKLCNGKAAPVPTQVAKYAYNDGDASTCYDVEYPLQIHGFDPNFHFVGMTFNPEAFADMKDKYFLLNGRSYPDTVTPGPLATQSTDGRSHYSQPLPSIINIPAGGRALLRIADLDVSEYQTLASLGIKMIEVGFMAKLLRDQAGNNLEYYTNSITLGGGESLDVILDTGDDTNCGYPGCAAATYTPGTVFYLYTPNLDHLSNDAENFGGLMTEIHIQ